MPAHEYSPLDALELLLFTLDERLPDLANHIREIIDSGTALPVPGQRSGASAERVRKSRPLTDEEALSVAVDVLRAYFVELPACIEAANREFAACAIDDIPGTHTWGKRGRPADDLLGQEKRISIETVPETARFQSREKGVVDLGAPAANQLEEQIRNVSHLQELIDFGEDYNGESTRIRKRD